MCSQPSIGWSLIPVLLLAHLTHSPAAESPPLTIDARNPQSVRVGAIVRNPKSFDQKVVSFVALLRMDGEGLILYESERDALAENIGRSILVQTFVNSPSYKKFNNRWVKAVGLLQAARKNELVRGHLILVEIVPVSSRVLPETNVYLILRNESATRLKFVVSFTKYGSLISSSCELDPGEFELFPFRNPRIIAETKSGNRVLDTRLKPPRESKEYFDPKERAFYYSFRGGKLQAVTASAGRRWPHKLLPERHRRSSRPTVIV